MDLTVVIITLNEEENLARCLDSIPRNLPIVILDSGSKDKTIEIAKSYNAEVHHREFTHYAEQKNAACQLARTDWVLSLDADERLSEEFVSNIQPALHSAKNKFEAFSVERRLWFSNKVLKFGKSKDFPIRLFDRTKVKFVGDIHEKVQVKSGRLGKLSGAHLTHFSYRNLEDYFSRFNKYTGIIAKNKAKKSPNMRFSLNLYGRFWFEFFNRYLLRLGFMDGYAGYCYALISSMYTFTKYAKQKEIIDDAN